MARLLPPSSAQDGNHAAAALDLMVASVAIAEDLPLCTTNPADFAGLATC
jgi:predicted nucleic acid-binding protein